MSAPTELVNAEPVAAEPPVQEQEASQPTHRGPTDSLEASVAPAESPPAELEIKEKPEEKSDESRLDSVELEDPAPKEAETLLDMSADVEPVEANAVVEEPSESPSTPPGDESDSATESPEGEALSEPVQVEDTVKNVDTATKSRPQTQDVLNAVASTSNPFSASSHPEGSDSYASTNEPKALRSSGRPSPDMFAEGSDVATLDHEGWDAFVDRLENQSVAWAPSLEHAELQRIEKGKVIIAFEQGSANASRVEKYGRELLRFLKRDFANVTGLGIDQVTSVEHCPYRRRLGRVKSELGRRREAIGEHPVVIELVERFDAKVARLRVYGEEDLNEH